MPAMLLIAFVILLICMLAYYFLQQEHARGTRSKHKYVNPMQPKRGFFDNLNDAMYAKTFGKGMMFA